MANSGGSFDPDSLVGQLQILNQKLEDPENWKDHIKISKLNKEKTEKNKRNKKKHIGTQRQTTKSKGNHRKKRETKEHL